MTNIEFAEKALGIARNYKTLYVNGTWGWPMNEANKARALRNTYNERPTRAAKIRAASPDTFGFDCCGLIKAIIWDWKGDPSQRYGGAGYAINGLPDINEAGMIAISDPQEDFSGVVPGAIVYRSGHIGIYVGDGLAVEATPSWADGVQITACNKPKAGYKTRTWSQWGKFPFVIYKEVKPVTYEQFVEFMRRYEQEKEKAPADEYAAEALSWAKEQGLIQGSSSGNQMPQSYLKREDMAVILQRYDEQKSVT